MVGKRSPANPVPWCAGAREREWFAVESRKQEIEKRRWEAATWVGVGAGVGAALGVAAGGGAGIAVGVALGAGVGAALAAWGRRGTV